MKNLKHYIQRAYKEDWAIGQFNFSDFSELKAIVNSAVNLKSPIILGTSEGESSFIGLEEAVLMRNLLRKKTRSTGSGQAGLPIFLNLDHGKSFDYLKKAIDAGYDMVHFDGSKLPLEENIKITREVVRYARWTRLRRGFGGQEGILVEGEIGKIGTDASRVYQEKFEIKEEFLTKSEEAEEYIKKTKVDLLAVSVGTFHGVDVTGDAPNIRLDRLEEIKVKIKTPLVLHGGSGIPENDIKLSLKLGISKININTEIRKAFAEKLLQDLQTGEIVPYKFLPGAIQAVSKVVEEKIRLFGSENKI